MNAVVLRTIDNVNRVERRAEDDLVLVRPNFKEFHRDPDFVSELQTQER